jgi:cyclohexa-1,5-dienecarbonyl-CoA hydratase
VSASAISVELERDNRLLRLSLNRPPANIIDATIVAAVQTALDKHMERHDLTAVLLTSLGPNFSFGASVEEHLPEQCEQMLSSLHRLFLSLLAFPLPVLVAVRGFCLGGGLELAVCGHLLFAAPDAKFGQPEIRVGVFAPVASCLLPERIARAHAEDLLLSGRNIEAREAVRIGLINGIADDPDAAALEYFDKQLAGHSASTLRHAVWAARAELVERVKRNLAIIEKRYLQELMSSNDAVEGLHAFLEKRPPRWAHR